MNDHIKYDPMDGRFVCCTPYIGLLKKESETLLEAGIYTVVVCPVCLRQWRIYPDGNGGLTPIFLFAVGKRVDPMVV